MTNIKETISIRKASLDDINDIMRVEYMCFDEDTIEDAHVYKQRIESFSDGFYVMECQNQIIGTISSEIWEYTESIDVHQFTLGHDIKERHTTQGNELYISSIAIIPPYRGHGLGDALFRKLVFDVIHLYPHITHLILLVSRNWTSAKKIYDRFGFEEIHVFKNFFGGHHVAHSDGIVMRKCLSKDMI